MIRLRSTIIEPPRIWGEYPHVLIDGGIFVCPAWKRWLARTLPRLFKSVGWEQSRDGRRVWLGGWPLEELRGLRKW